ncbi:phosphoribosylglycinamide formyltransferase [bacterium]|nr:phosphoribosylglycinamide formyltransferase [bacterium]
MDSSTPSAIPDTLIKSKTERGREQLKETKIRIGVLASGRGSNLQAIIDACKDGYIPGEVVCVISDKADAFALERARREGIPAIFLDPTKYESREEYDGRLVEILNEHKVDLVCLAGYMRILTPRFIDAFRNRIMNIHPALIPAFCGKGMYGLRVHKAVLDFGVKVTGCTVHFVTEEVDLGPIIIQIPVMVREDDTPESLSERVLKREHRAYPRAIKLFAEGRLQIEGRRVRILPPNK